MTPGAWRDDLDERQLEAVLAPGPVVVAAGAGTGKTKTLVARLARVLEEGADPDRVLLLTFSRRAAREMLHRASLLGAVETSGRVWGGTFHAIANRLLRRHGQAVGLVPSFTILDQADAVELFGLVRTDLALGEQSLRFPKKETLADIYSWVANARQPLEDALRERFPWCRASTDGIRAVFTAYAERKRSRAMLDYDDLLLYWRALLHAPGAEPLAARFDHVLVDEAQDTNLIQADILAGLAADGDGLFVVGDEAQAIYGFRAAGSGALRGIAERLPTATVVPLAANHRSVQPVLDVANGVLAEAPGLVVRDLRAVRRVAAPARPVLARVADESDEAAWVATRVLELREVGVPLRDQAVLFRSGHHSARLEVELGRRRVPFVKYGGLRFLEWAHVKDLLAFLRLLENGSDELAWHRVLGMLEGVGPATARAVVADLRLAEPGAPRRLVDEPPPAPARATDDLELLRGLLRTCLDHADAGVPAVEIEIVRTAGRPLFERRYATSLPRLGDLEQLQDAAAAYATRAQFLADLVLDPPTRTGDLAGPPLLDDDWLVLSTIHSAKGLEWSAVYVIHATDGNLPSDMSLTTPEGLEEERRLLYVAVTRARDHLHVVQPLRFYDHPRALDDPHGFAQPSRFVTPVLDRFDLVERARPEAPTVVGTPGPDPVASELAALWG